jgi:hypothetical protein
MAAAWLMGLHFSDIRMTLTGPVLVPTGAGALAFLFLGVRNSLFGILPTPITAGVTSAIFAVTLTYVIFSRDERRAALDHAYVLLQGRQRNIS